MKKLIIIIAAMFFVFITEACAQDYPLIEPLRGTSCDTLRIGNLRYVDFYLDNDSNFVQMKINGIEKRIVDKTYFLKYVKDSVKTKLDSVLIKDGNYAKLKKGFYLKFQDSSGLYLPAFIDDVGQIAFIDNKIIYHDNSDTLKILATIKDVEKMRDSLNNFKVSFLNGFHTTLINDTLFVSLDLESPLKLSGTQVSIQAADSLHDGYLKKEDWRKIQTVTSSLEYEPPIFNEDGTVYIQQADSSHDGYLTKEDWRRIGSGNSNYNFSPAFWITHDSTGTNVALSLNSPLYTDYTNSRLAIVKADATHDGYLTKEDFNLFKNGYINGYKFNFSHGLYSSLVNDTLYVSADVDSPLKINGNQLTIQQADTSHDGYITKETFRQIGSSSISLGVPYTNYGSGNSWTFVYDSPLEIVSGSLRVKQVSSSVDGYLTHQDYSKFNSAADSLLSLSGMITDNSGDILALGHEIDSLASPSSAIKIHWNNLTHVPSFAAATHNQEASTIHITGNVYLDSWITGVAQDIGNMDSAIGTISSNLSDLTTQHNDDISNIMDYINDLQQRVTALENQ